LIIGLLTLAAAVLALVPAYFIFWQKPDTVFDRRAVEIPLSDEIRRRFEEALSPQRIVEKSAKKYSVTEIDLPRKLPDKLLYVNIRDVGDVPSSGIKVEIVVPGTIQDKEIKDAGPAFGHINKQTSSDSEISSSANISPIKSRLESGFRSGTHKKDPVHLLSRLRILKGRVGKLARLKQHNSILRSSSSRQ
jgi:hypothetical protein